MDIDYINDIYWIIIHLFHHIKKAKQLSESSIDEMMSLAIDLLSLLEQYKDDKYDYYPMKKQK